MIREEDALANKLLQCGKYPAIVIQSSSSVISAPLCFTHLLFLERKFCNEETSSPTDCARRRGSVRAHGDGAACALACRNAAEGRVHGRE